MLLACVSACVWVALPEKMKPPKCPTRSITRHLALYPILHGFTIAAGTLPAPTPSPVNENTPEPTMPPPTMAYLGCFNDKKTDRIMEKLALKDKISMTQQVRVCSTRKKQAPPHVVREWCVTPRLKIDTAFPASSRLVPTDVRGNVQRAYVLRSTVRAGGETDVETKY